MSNNARFAEIAALAGDPGRASMLNGLMDGRALTASELAQLAGITAQTASSHLTTHDRGRTARRWRSRDGTAITGWHPLPWRR